MCVGHTADRRTGPETRNLGDDGQHVDELTGAEVAEVLAVLAEEAVHELGLDEGLEPGDEGLVQPVAQHGADHDEQGRGQRGDGGLGEPVGAGRLQRLDHAALQVGLHDLPEGDEEDEQGAQQHEAPVLAHVRPHDFLGDVHVCVSVNATATKRSFPSSAVRLSI